MTRTRAASDMPFNSLDELATANLPVLLPDTCILLDVIRSPLRVTADAKAIQATQLLISAISETGNVGCIVARQVFDEHQENKGNVISETTNELKELQDKIKRIDGWCSALGLPSHTDISHYLGRISLVDGLVKKWISGSIIVETTDQIAGNAHRRVMEPKTPARPGKEAFKDCVVIETYLQAARDLRKQGHKDRIVFASSNTKEFVERPSSSLKPDIAAEFKELRIDYARALHEIPYRIGIGNREATVT